MWISAADHGAAREKALARRSFLIVPANRPKFVASAHQRGADAITDLSTELGIDPTLPGCDLSWAHANVLVAARAAGLAPYGLIRGLADFADLDALAENVAASRQFGYVGASCIHPGQVPIVNAGFSPSPDEIAQAHRVIEAFERAEREGTAAVALDGRMVDVPVAERARKVLRRARGQ